MASQPVRADLHSAADPARIVEYRRGGALLSHLPWLLGLYALFLWGLAYSTDPTLPRWALWASFLALIGLTAFGAWRCRPSAPPELLLAPQGLALRFNGMIAVPWAMVRDVETRSFAGSVPFRGRHAVHFADVTMIRVPPGFLQAERDAGRFGTFDPTTDWVIHPAGGGDWIALHHESYGLTPPEVRGPVEARWRAYGDGSQPELPSRLPPLRLGGFRPAHPLGFMLGTAMSATAILIILANLAGLWETRAQASARAWAERMAIVSPEEEALQRHLQRRDEAFERMQRMREEMMMRTYSRPSAD